MTSPSEHNPDLERPNDRQEPDPASLSEQAGEELEAFFSDLQAKVDELRSMNRNLRATIEKLEANKDQAIARADTLQNINYGLEVKLGLHTPGGRSDDGEAVDDVEIPVVIVDAQGRLKRISTVARDKLGLSEDAVGRSLRDTSLGPDNDKIVEAITRVAVSGGTETLEARFDDGRWFVVFVLSAELPAGDDPEFVVEFIETTNRRTMQSRLRRADRYADTIFETFHSPLVILDGDLVIEEANSAFLAAFDYERGDTIGRSILQIDDGRWDHASLRELLQAVFEKNILLENFEFSYDTSLPPSRHFLLEAHRLEDLDLILLGLKEVTAERRTRQKLLSREAELESLNRTLEKRVEERTEQVRNLMRALTLAEQEERRRLSLVLHDDLQQRLYGLEMVLDLILDTDDPEESRRLLAQAGDILRDATDLTRTLSSELSPPMIKLTDVEETFRWLQLRKKELHDLDVEIDVSGDLSVPNRALLDLVYQILRELLFNVVKHAGVNRARLSAWQEDENVYIQVEDEGNGFDTSTLSAGGDITGSFGLASIRYRLETVGGRLLVNSEPGRGTRITLVVPVELHENATVD